QRIASKAHLLDEFPGLIFKAYLYAVHRDQELPSQDNIYAPFYLWSDHKGMANFLSDTGFAALTRDFGQPPVQMWIPWHVALADDLRATVCASREWVTINSD